MRNMTALIVYDIRGERFYALCSEIGAVGCLAAYWLRDLGLG